MFNPSLDGASIVSPRVSEAPHDLQLFYQPSADMRESVAAMASTIQALIGPIPNTSIVITDDMDGMKSRLLGALKRGADLSEVATGAPVIRLPHKTNYFDKTEGFAYAQPDDSHAIVCIKRKHARAISDPQSPQHINAVGTFAHELGHVRAIRAGFDCPKNRIMTSEELVAFSSVAEYIAVRSELFVMDKFYGEGFDQRRVKSFARSVVRRTEGLNSQTQRLRSMRRNKNFKHLLGLGYAIGTVNGYLDGFRAAETPERMPVRPDDLKGMTPIAAKLLNRTRGGLAALHRSLESGGTPGPLIERAIIEHRQAFEAASTMVVPQQRRRPLRRDNERD